MKKIKLSTQFYIIFTSVILITSLLFTLGMNFVFEDFRVEQNKEQLQQYANNVWLAYKEEGLNSPFLRSDYNGFVIYDNDVVSEISKFDVISIIYDTQSLLDESESWTETHHFENTNNKSYYFYTIKNENITLIAFTDNSYLINLGTSFNVILRLSFVSLVLLGNTMILIWSRIMLERIHKLQVEVSKLSSSNYHQKIMVEGDDEISDLARIIEAMRFELETNEKTKQEMIQNISHDFKTPIAVIQSYAEAIRDEITSIEDTQIIIKQADILNRKVKQLIELTKIENDVTEVSRTPVVIKEVIKHILDQQKYRSGIVFETSLDDSTWFGVYDYFHSAFSNIVDNMLRYANTKISIHLEKNVLTFYNDGEAIEENLIEKLFKPYEKGPKGQFGLGLSIVKRTMDLFDLTITIKNEDHGVKFIIAPR
jgi:two-component system, OmpR family, sensor histidine kinase CssS